MALWMVGGCRHPDNYWPYNLFDMQVEGTRAAFEAMISKRGIFHKLGVSKSTVAGWKIYLREGKSISLDKMEEMLIKGGATVTQEKVWEILETKIKRS